MIIGFDGQQTLRIFDFGLARELHDADKDEDGTYRNLTSMTGAIRYMAPECAAGLNYNQSADVYSWAMLMYYMMALEPPFGFYTERMIIDRACKGYRPTIFKRWSSNIKEVISAAWDGDLKNRPSFLDISLILKNELHQFGGKVSGVRSISGATHASDDTNDATAKDITEDRFRTER
jgi:serine/threonine protein kinase